MTSRRAMVLASGGIDSTTCLFYYRELGHDVEALFVDYGHPANPAEYEHIDSLCKQNKFPLGLLKLSGTTIDSQWEIRGRNAFFIITALMARPTFSGLLSLGIHGGSPVFLPRRNDPFRMWYPLLRSFRTAQVFIGNISKLTLFHYRERLQVVSSSR